MNNYDWYIIKQNSKNKVLSISSPYFNRVAAISSLSSMYSNTDNVIKASLDNFIYINIDGEDITVRVLHGSPQYVCGLMSDYKDIMDKLMKIRRLL